MRVQEIIDSAGFQISVTKVAMVCVAAVALGSSIYAWFVSNNTVKGTTTNISAQSNAPFLKIDNVAVTAASGTTKTLTEPTGESELLGNKLPEHLKSGGIPPFFRVRP